MPSGHGMILAPDETELYLLSNGCFRGHFGILNLKSFALTIKKDT